MEKIRNLRITFLEWTKPEISAKTTEENPITILCKGNQIEEIEELSYRIRTGSTFNLLNATLIDDNRYEAELIILEPDYLIDISTLSECFKPYGNHPLNYSLSRLQAKETSAPLLLGNTANFFIDEFVNEDEKPDFNNSLKKLFRLSPFEFTACEELKDSKKEQDFFRNCLKQFNHIQKMVDEIFPKAGIDKKKIVLEPSFISNHLGLQGRLDIMLSDFSAFIELKSGKAVEDFRSGGQFIHSAKNHYIQMILYLAVLEFNLDMNPDDINSYLLYSKYPLLSKERHSRKDLQKALQVRNQLVAYEFEIQNENESSITEELLEQISSDKLNTENLEGNFFDNYLRPGIDKHKYAFSLLSDLEKSYYLRLYTFIVKELWLSKVGEREYEGVKRATVLWNAPMEDKLIAGEILYDLKIAENKSDTEEHTISLIIPVYKDLYLPNFREGDAVILYERNSESDQINNRQIFKGAVESLENNRIVVRLRYRQKNKSVWNPDSFYAIMHDYMDTTYTAMFRSLTAFAHANPERRDLLLGQRKPELNEYFLLIGPPGTGKTSVYLKQMVEKELSNNKTTILLLSYTNRAVDEICKALEDIHTDLPYIRIGSELNCAKEFRKHLLENTLEKCNNRNEVSKVIQNCRIFTGTVASLWNKPELFLLKQFDLAIIDEATQLLEPHLLGLLSQKSFNNENAIRKFILIGDHKQLPAVVLQTREDSRVEDVLLNAIGLNNLSDSLFERLYRYNQKQAWQDNFDILNKQGRMHPDICAFPSKFFYNDQLETLGLSHQLEKWSKKQRVLFHFVKPFVKESSEKINRKEAEKIVAICKELYQTGEDFNPEKIGIITPFRNQIALIRQCLQETGIAGFSAINVDTVERFQGSQRDIIIYSFCIKTEFQLNALPNLLEENEKLIDRKLNVALTRARKQLHLIGNEELLSKNELYKKLIDFVKENQNC